MTGPTGFSPRKSPRQQRSRATVEKILAGAAQVFAEEGYAATTDRIASRGGVSVGSVYQYFPNKEALLLELAQRHLRDSAVRLEQVLRPGRPSAQWLPEAVSLVVDLHADDDLHRVIYEQAPRTPELADSFLAAQAELGRAVATLLAGELELADPGRTATVLVALVESLTHRLVGHVPQAVLTEEVTRAALAYLDAARAEGPGDRDR